MRVRTIRWKRRRRECDYDACGDFLKSIGAYVCGVDFYTNHSWVWFVDYWEKR